MDFNKIVNALPSLLIGCGCLVFSAIGIDEKGISVWYAFGLILGAVNFLMAGYELRKAIA